MDMSAVRALSPLSEAGGGWLGVGQISTRTKRTAPGQAGARALFVGTSCSPPPASLNETDDSQRVR